LKEYQEIDRKEPITRKLVKNEEKEKQIKGKILILLNIFSHEML
jgi:hypothetical protein